MEREIFPGIVSNPAILAGRPVLKGHRIAVSQLLAQLGGGMTMQEIKDDYALSDEEILVVLRYAAETARKKDLEHVQHA